jgi:type II secretory pathway pseudopilin PulG
MLKKINDVQHTHRRKIVMPALPTKKSIVQSGFSLVELGLVLGVMSILATTMLPNIIGGMRTRLTDRMIEEVNLAKDAAQNYYIQHGRWPGQGDDEGEGSCALDKDENGMQTLQKAGYLVRQPRDPWSGEDFELGFISKSFAEDSHCILNLKTADHESIAYVLPKIEHSLAQHFGMQCQGGNNEEKRRCSFQFAPPKLQENVEELIDKRLEQRKPSGGSLVGVKVEAPYNRNNFDAHSAPIQCPEGHEPVYCTSNGRGFCTQPTNIAYSDNYSYIGALQPTYTCARQTVIKRGMAPTAAHGEASCTLWCTQSLEDDD